MAKVLVSVDDRTLRRIDRVAAAQGLSRSAYLSQLAERDLRRLGGQGASPAARRAVARLDRLFARQPARDATAAVRAERDAR